MSRGSPTQLRMPSPVSACELQFLSLDFRAMAEAQVPSEAKGTSLTLELMDLNGFRLHFFFLWRSPAP